MELSNNGIKMSFGRFGRFGGWGGLNMAHPYLGFILFVFLHLVTSMPCFIKIG